MSVEKLSLLRKKCREQKVQFRVIKNTLLKRAFNARGITALDDFLEGPTGLVFSPENEMAPAKILVGLRQGAREAAQSRRRSSTGGCSTRRRSRCSRRCRAARCCCRRCWRTFIAPMTQFLAAIDATLALPAVMADVLEREKSKAS